MDEVIFPKDLVDFLKQGNQLTYNPAKCEAGQIALLAFDKLVLGEVYIDSEESPLAKNDPHVGEKGYYAVPAINLVADCDGYDPEGILIWLPEQKVFGTWDIDHWDVLIFPNATWSDIASDPIKFINAQWWPKGVDCQYFAPFPKYPFKLGRPF